MRIVTKKVVAIVQARMASTRLPGKVLRDICGKPMLWHIVRRIQHARYIDDVVIACTASGDDDALNEFAVSNALGIYRGSENDIVDRILKAGQVYHADSIVRIWGDCPLVDPKLIDKVLSEFADKYDYANTFNPPTYPVGIDFEVYSRKTLERIWNETNDMFYRQYPFEYVYGNSTSFKTLYDNNAEDVSNIDLTVDYLEDLELVREVFKGLHREESVFDLADILGFLEAHPELEATNDRLPRNTEYRDARAERRSKR